MDNFIVIVFIYIKGRKESVIVMIKPTHSKVWKTAESNYVLNKLNKLFIYYYPTPLLLYSGVDVVVDINNLFNL